MNKRKIRGATGVAIVCGLLFVASGVQAQESADAALNSCVKKEQVLSTAKGVGLGAIAGIGAMFAVHKTQDAGKAALIGAVAGGIAGFATAYYTAVDTCFKKNPAWIPESKLERTKDFDSVKHQIGYRADQGPLTKVRSVRVSAPVTPGGQAEVTSDFIVMNPHGDDAPITIQRKLFVDTDGKETELAFPGGGSQQITVEPGEQRNVVHIPIPQDAKPGSDYRIEVGVSTEGSPMAVESGRYTVAAGPAVTAAN